MAITVTLDSDEVADGVARTAYERGLTIGVLLELDTGMRRLGVVPGPPPWSSPSGSPRSRDQLAGVFTHEGHVYTAARTTPSGSD